MVSNEIEQAITDVVRFSHLSERSKNGNLMPSDEALGAVLDATFRLRALLARDDARITRLEDVAKAARSAEHELGRTPSPNWAGINARTKLSDALAALDKETNDATVE